MASPHPPLGGCSGGRRPSEFLESLDRMVGFAGRGLLIPADSMLQRLGRVLGRLG